MRLLRRIPSIPSPSFIRYALIVGLLFGALYGSFSFFEHQTNRFHEISRRDQDNLDWNFFQVHRTFIDISRLIESPLPLEEKANKIGPLWDVFASSMEILTSGQAVQLVNYKSPTGKPDIEKIFLAFTKKYAELSSYTNHINTATADGWNQETWDYLLQHHQAIYDLSLDVAQNANFKWNIYLTEKQKSLEDLNDTMQNAYRFEILLILLFGCIGFWQVHALRNAKNILQETNNTLQASQISLKETNSELITSQEQIAAAFKDRTYFIAKSSHELRTPLNAITTFLNLALDETTLEETRNHLQHAFTAAKHLQVLTDDILNFSKMDSISLCYSTWSLSDLFHDCLRMHASDIFNSNATIVNNIHPHILHTDFVRTKQIILNLLSNSLKYNTNPSPVITLSSSIHNETLIISVHDNGNGIPPTLLPMLFQPFSRGVSVNSPIPGTGIGLSICKKIASALQGTLTLNTDQPGSCFQLSLPSSLIQPSTSTSPTPSAPTPNIPSTPTPEYISQTFLLIIHNPSTYDTIKNTVEPLGAEVLNIPDWETFEDIFQPHSSNWLVTDQPLPLNLSPDITDRYINLQNIPPASCGTLLTHYVQLNSH